MVDNSHYQNQNGGSGQQMHGGQGRQMGHDGNHNQHSQHHHQQQPGGGNSESAAALQQQYNNDRGRGGAPQGKAEANINELESYVYSIEYKRNESKLKQKVCVHWLKKVCRKGDACEYLHMYIEDKIPICKFFKENGHCHQQDTQCVYRHPQEQDQGASKKQEQCPYYERGFCKLGRNQCQFWHGPETVYQQVCVNYFLGFCPVGPNCKYTHVKSFITPQDLQLKTLANFPMEENWMDGQLHQIIGRPHHNGYIRQHIDQKFICYRCGENGHKSTYCQEDPIPQTELEKIQAQNPENNLANQRVVCFSCHQKGHYANACPQKAQRAATNASGQDKPAMSREEKLWHQVERLKHDDDQGGAPPMSNVGAPFNERAKKMPLLDEGEMYAEAPMFGMNEYMSGGAGPGQAGHTATFYKQLLQDHESQVVYNNGGAGDGHSVGNQYGGGHLQSQNAQMLAHGNGAAGDHHQYGSNGMSPRGANNGRGNFNKQQAASSQSLRGMDQMIVDSQGSGVSGQYRGENSPRGIAHSVPGGDYNNQRSNQNGHGISNTTPTTINNIAGVLGNENGSRARDNQNSTTTINNIGCVGGPLPSQQQQVASLLQQQQPHNEEVANSSSSQHHHQNLNNDLIATKKEFERIDPSSQRNNASQQQLQQQQQYLLQQASDQVINNNYQAASLSSNQQEQQKQVQKINPIRQQQPQSTVEQQYQQQQQQPHLQVNPQPNSLPAEQVIGTSPKSAQGAAVEEETEYIKVGPITGIDISELPFSNDQIRDAIYELEIQIRIDEIKEAQPFADSSAIMQQINEAITSGMVPSFMPPNSLSQTQPQQK